MASRLEYENAIEAEMRPDVYAGDNCDEHRPRWCAHALGDMDSETTTDPMVFSPETFPPGTKVVVKVPRCPECGVSADYAHIAKSHLCECGFDWKAWAEDQFS